MTLYTTSPGDEREAFEAWRRRTAKMDPDSAVARRGFGDDAGYENTYTRCMHMAWMARASSSTVQQVGADALDADRYRRLKEWFASANFFPEEMDLDPGVALIFIAPLGLEVSADLDSTIDGAAKSEQGDQQ